MISKEMMETDLSIMDKTIQRELLKQLLEEQNEDPYLSEELIAFVKRRIKKIEQETKS